MFSIIFTILICFFIFFRYSKKSFFYFFPKVKNRNFEKWIEELIFSWELKERAHRTKHKENSIFGESILKYWEYIGLVSFHRILWGLKWVNMAFFGLSRWFQDNGIKLKVKVRKLLLMGWCRMELIIKKSWGPFLSQFKVFSNWYP